MKSNKIFISAIAAIAFMLLFATSCKKDFYTNANVNPNAPASVPPKTLLPAIEVGLAYVQGGDMSLYTASAFTQQGFGFAREAQAYYNYQIVGTNLPENLWDNLYSVVMNNAYTLTNLANTNGYNAYAGIANILMAYSLQITVDVWGNVPYSQAFLGAANLDPHYDQASAIYGDIINLLNTGIAELRNSSPGVMVPSTDDMIASTNGTMYGGSATSWIAFANAIKARIYIHQCKTNNAAMCANAFAAADSALTEGFAGAEVLFLAPPNSSPQYQFNTTWGDFIYVTSGGVHVTLFDTMTALSDPRIGVYFDTVGAAAAQAGAPILGMGTTSYYGNTTSPIELITKEEVDFIEAEATLRLSGTITTAQGFYANAINDNFTKLGISSAAAAYITANPLNTSSVAAALHTLGEQEWIALFLNPESWVCWRRTGSPALVAPVGATNYPNIARRMPLPTTEVTENANAPQGETCWNPLIFWDN